MRLHALRLHLAYGEFQSCHPARLDNLRAQLLKIKVFWDVAPCGLVIRMTFQRTAVKEVWLGLFDPED